jgi:outer membrane beta-barrel protein
MRRETIARVLIGLALCAVPSTSHAQRRRGRRGGGGADTTQTAPPAGGGDDSGSMSFSTDEAAQSPAPTDNAAQPTDTTAAQPAADANAGGGIGLEGIGGADVRATRHPLTENISAVQQIYALRNRRLEIQPTVAVSLNDPYVSHTGVGIGLNFWVTNVLAIGANFLWYQGIESESDLNFSVRRSTRLAVPINEYQLGAHLSFTYVPIYGKFAMFNEFIFQYDAYVMGGVGLMRTRPIPVVDPEVRRFEFGERIAFNVGIGLRVFVTRWLAIFAEIRDYMYLESVESLEVALGADRDNPATWLQSSPAFINNVTAHIGLAVFIPFDFSYRLPR